MGGAGEFSEKLDLVRLRHFPFRHVHRGELGRGGPLGVLARYRGLFHDAGHELFFELARVVVFGRADQKQEGPERLALEFRRLHGDERFDPGLRQEFLGSKEAHGRSIVPQPARSPVTKSPAPTIHDFSTTSPRHVEGQPGIDTPNTRAGARTGVDGLEPFSLECPAAVTITNPVCRDVDPVAAALLRLFHLAAQAIAHIKSPASQAHLDEAPVVAGRGAGDVACWTCWEASTVDLGEE